MNINEEGINIVSKGINECLKCCEIQSRRVIDSKKYENSSNESKEIIYNNENINCLANFYIECLKEARFNSVKYATCDKFIYEYTKDHKYGKYSISKKSGIL